MQYIGIITAMGIEFNYISKILNVKKSKIRHGIKIAVGSYNGINFLLAKTGMGIKKAYKATKSIIENYDIIAITNIGIAGGINPSLKIGDIVIGRESLFENDIDNEKRYETDKNMTYLFERIADVEKGICYMGTILTVNKGISSIEKKNHIYKKYKADTVDMETAAIAKIAEENNIPFMAIKAVSDLADESIGFEEDIMTDKGEFDIVKMLKIFISHPFSTIIKIRKITKNMQFAISKLHPFIKELPKYVCQPQ